MRKRKKLNFCYNHNGLKNMEQIEDSIMQEFFDFVNKYKNDIHITQDKNLELDPYFYERQKKLHQIRNDMKNGKMRMLSEDEADEEIDLFFKELEK